MSVTDIDAGSLRQWHHDYIAADGNTLDIESALIAAVDSDPYDTAEIEKQIQQTILKTHVSDGYCVKCQHLLGNWPNLGTQSWTHKVGRSCGTVEIESAARQGCKFCCFLLTQLEDSEALGTFRRIEKRLELLQDRATASLSISNWASGAQLLWLNLPGKVTTGCNYPLAHLTKFESHRALPTAIHCKDAPNWWDVAADWIHNCSQTHRPCQNTGTIEAKPRPSRLIAIADGVIKLVLTAEWATMPLYATLSYSWGLEGFVKLTADSLSSFQDSIPYDHLPKTFRDAIYIARRLGINYIWIDALCILQDTENSNDWRSESGHVRYIYGGSHVNIAASCATNAHGGCLTRRADYSGGFLARVETEDVCWVRTFHTGGVYEQATLQTYLAGRAWALQEKLLAPRTICFGERGMFWECRCNIASEYLPAGFPGKLGSHLVCPQEKAWPWDQIVLAYSKGKLTYGADKLSALSGIARRQHEVTGDDYLAGMWRNRFLEQLGWMSMSQSIRPTWRAPTWSWTSVDGLVRYEAYWNHDSLEREVHAHVDHVSTQPAGPDRFGRIQGAELRLSCSGFVRGYYHGASVPDSQERDTPQNGSVSFDASARKYSVSMDCIEITPLKAGDVVFLLPLYSGHSGRYTRAQEDDAHSPDADSEEDDISDRLRPDLMVRGLVLERSGLAKGSFRRAGVFDFQCRSDLTEESRRAQEPYYEFLRAWKEFGRSTAESECVEVLSVTEHPVIRYIIDIE